MSGISRVRLAGLSGAAKSAAGVAVVAGAVGALTVVPITAASARRAHRSAVGVRAASRAVPIDPPPSVTINTDARGGTGIAIEGPTPAFNAFYPGDPGRWLHIVVLNREDLALVSNTSYDCPEATKYPKPSQLDRLKPCIDRVRADLAKLENRDHTNLVIATSQYDGNPKSAITQPPVGMASALLPSLGARPWDWWKPDGFVFRGTYSAVGIAGQPGLGSEKVGGQQAPGSGRLIDNLVRDNEGKYGLVPGQQVEYDTQAPGSGEKTNVIKIGDKTYGAGADRPNRLNGIQVLIVDTQTLEAKSYFFESYGGRYLHDWAGLAEVLRAVNSAALKPFARPKLVFFATRGDFDFAPSEAGDVVRVADEITKDGGTRTRFMHALWAVAQHPDHPDSYTLVGKAGVGTGEGHEAVGGPKSGTELSTVPLTGTLERTGPYYDFRTQSAANAVSQTARGDVFTGATQLLQTVGGMHSGWPEQGNPGRTAAIEYLGVKVLGTKEPRTQYWTLPWTANEWNGISADIEQQPYPLGGTKKFGREDLRWAKDELEKEIGWLNSEHEYLQKRAKPFTDTTLKSWSELQTIASKIDKEVKAPADQTTKAQVAAIAEFAVDLAKELPLAGTSIGATAAIYKFATEFASIGGEPVEDTFDVKVSEAGDALEKRMTAAQHYLSVEVPEVVASDYKKLEIVGSCGSPLVKQQVACPFNPSDWSYTSLDQTHAAEGLLRGSKVAAYGALLPAKYHAYELPVSKHKEANKKYAGRVFVQCFYPFADEPETGQVAIPKSADENGDYQITALGYLTGKGLVNDRWEMHPPPASVTNPLFGTRSGELEINKEEFFSRFYPSRDSLPHYPERDTLTGWDLGLCQ
ncbi:MAG TPA: hypothetical protein VGL78_19165 [Solirubrobacteraceae bacterium]|jgi:hypothetical protein